MLLNRAAMLLAWLVADDRSSDRSCQIDSPAHEKCDRSDPAVALGFALAMIAIVAVGRDSFNYDGCDDPDGTDRSD